MESRESLFRDGAFEAPRRDSFIRDEFTGAARPARAAGRDPGLDEFFSESDIEPKRGGFRLQRTEIVLAIAVIALVVGGVSIWTLMSGRSAAAEAPVAASADPVQPETPPPAQAAVPQAPVSKLPAVTAIRQQSTSARTAAVAPRTTQGVRPAPPAARSGDAPRPVASFQSNVLTPTLLTDTPVESPAPAGFRTDAVRIDAAGLSRVYSSADADVVPPKMVIEDVPAALIVGMRTRMQAVELMVTEEGDVSRVRLLTEQRRILDTMLLSRAKMWKFTPALRDGRPVRYRLVVNWETND